MCIDLICTECQNVYRLGSPGWESGDPAFTCRTCVDMKKHRAKALAGQSDFGASPTIQRIKEDQRKANQNIEQAMRFLEFKQVYDKAWQEALQEHVNAKSGDFVDAASFKAGGVRMKTKHQLYICFSLMFFCIGVFTTLIVQAVIS